LAARAKRFGSFGLVTDAKPLGAAEDLGFSRKNREELQPQEMGGI
jgi:hypothetical protein